MWIISDKGFVSLVQHDTDPELIRARARRKAHLLDTFDLTEDEIIDYGPNPPDYRWHANVPREDVAEAISDSIMNMSYTSHVKESVSGNDRQMYRAMMSTWNAFYELQRPPRTDGDWWTSRFEDIEDDDAVGPDEYDRMFPSARQDRLETILGRARQGTGRNRGGMRRNPRDGDDWWRTPAKPRDDGKADKPLEELTGSLADRMLQSAGRLDQTPPATEHDDLLAPPPKKAAKKIPPPPATPKAKS